MDYPVKKKAMKKSYFGQRSGSTVSLVVIHYTAGHESGDLATLSGATDRKVSVHYLVGRKEEFGIVALVPEDKAAWHAGVSSWTDHTGAKRGAASGNPKGSVNSFSIGIEISNMGAPEPFTDFQYEAVAQIARDLIKRYPHINIERFVGHNQVSPGRKIDPGPLWDWDRFRKMVIETSQPLKVVLLPGTLIDCFPEMEDGATRVHLAELCSGLEIAPVPGFASLSAHGAQHGTGGSVTVALRSFAESQGYDVLAHRLASENKIYLRKRDPSFDEDEDSAEDHAA